ncbi:hypothetical protein KDW46_02380 [Burkholderia vietnamiensis]|nr:hypothetical protein [Burkholderia vietnamiensis]
MKFAHLDDAFVLAVLEAALRNAPISKGQDQLEEATKRAVRACIKADQQLAAYQRRLAKALQRSA